MSTARTIITVDSYKTKPKHKATADKVAAAADLDIDDILRIEGSGKSWEVTCYYRRRADGELRLDATGEPLTKVVRVEL